MLWTTPVHGPVAGVRSDRIRGLTCTVGPRAAVHTPGTDRDAVTLPPARLGPKSHTLGRRPGTEGSDGDPVEPTSTGVARSTGAARESATSPTGDPPTAPRGRPGPPGARTSPAPPSRRRAPGTPSGAARRRGARSGAACPATGPAVAVVAGPVRAPTTATPRCSAGSRPACPPSGAGRRTSRTARCSGAGRSWWAPRSPSTPPPRRCVTASSPSRRTRRPGPRSSACCSAELIRRVAAGLGDGIVTRMRIHGPSAPSWRRGPRHVRGRGPRDTYG